MPLLYKFLIYAAIIASIFTAGMITEYKFHLAGEAKQAKVETKKAQQGQNDIIKFNQELSKTDEKKQPCYNTKLSPAVIELLK